MSLVLPVTVVTLGIGMCEGVGVPHPQLAPRRNEGGAKLHLDSLLAFSNIGGPNSYN